MAFKKQKKNAIAVTADTNEEYVTWLSLVPAKERSRMADMVKNHSLSSFGDLADLTAELSALETLAESSQQIQDTVIDFATVDVTPSIFNKN